MRADPSDLKRLCDTLAAGGQSLRYKRPKGFEEILRERLPDDCLPALESAVERWIREGIDEWPSVRRWLAAIREVTGGSAEATPEPCESCNSAGRTPEAVGWVLGWIYAGWVHPPLGDLSQLPADSTHPALLPVQVPCAGCEQYLGRGRKEGQALKLCIDGRMPWYCRVVRLDGRGRWEAEWDYGKLRTWAEDVRRMCRWVLAQAEEAEQLWRKICGADSYQGKAKDAPYEVLAHDLLEALTMGSSPAARRQIGPVPPYPGTTDDDWGLLVADWSRRGLWPSGLSTGREDGPAAERPLPEPTEQRDDWGETRADLT